MSVLTVTQLNNYISFKLKSDIKLKSVMLQGEISNFVNHFKSGHLYFSIKDSTSSIKAVMFASSASKLRFIPRDGMSVIVCGNIEVFERDGVYQIYVVDMQPSGIGGLYLAFEQLKEKLLREGLFDEKYKKPLPEFPERIGVLTSSTGAALQDILNILGRRYPVAEVVIFPTIVQGELSEKSICDNLSLADNQNLDIIILGRGGGSFEDLMSFNSETVARAIFEAQTPIISAVGHETDTTIADFVADLRAPTPSASAELAVPDVNDLYSVIEGFRLRLDNLINLKINDNKLILKNKTDKLNWLSPSNLLSAKQTEIDNTQKKIYNSYKNILREKEQLLAEKISLLNSLSPLNVLSRGYSMVYKNNEIIPRAEMLKTNDEITIRFSDKNISAKVIDIDC